MFEWEPEWPAAVAYLLQVLHIFIHSQCSLSQAPTTHCRQCRQLMNSSLAHRPHPVYHHLQCCTVVMGNLAEGLGTRQGEEHSDHLWQTGGKPPLVSLQYHAAAGESRPTQSDPHRWNCSYLILFTTYVPWNLHMNYLLWKASAVRSYS